MENNIVKCDVCGKEMIKKKINKEVEFKGKKIEFKEIEAYVCEDCNNIILENNEVKMIENLLKALNQNKELDILNLEETADLLRVSNQTIYNMIKDGKLKAYKIGREWRFMRKDIESFIYSSSSMVAAKGGRGDKEDIDKIKKRLGILDDE